MTLQLPYLISPDALKAVRFGGKPRADLKDSDFVFSDDRSFPIMAPADVTDAVSSWGRYKGKHTFDEFKKNLTALAKRKGFAKELPAKWETPAPSGKSIGELTNIKSGARHSAGDQKMIQTIHDHAESLGATCGGSMSADEAKSLAVKMMDMPLMATPADNEAMSETWDINDAANALIQLSNLACGEICETDADTQDALDLIALMRGVVTFINGEIDELEETLTAAPADEAVEPAAGKSISLIDQDTVIAFGSAVKSLPDGHLGGYLIRFSTKVDPDLVGDYFDKETDFGFTPGMTTPIYFNHRLPLKTRNSKYITIKDKIGEATLGQDDYGITIDAIVYNREMYQQAINDAAQSKSLNWSSGTANHLIDREPAGNAKHITKWPLGLDASLTPIAAEPRNEAYPLKSLASLQNVVPQTRTSQTVATATSTGANAHSEIEREGERLRLDLLELEMNLSF